MKNKKYLFNLLLLKYNKYKAKLLRFRLTGRNEHRQSVLEKHIERLSVKLNNLLGSIRKVGAVAAVSTALVLAAPNSANAQAVFAGQIGSAVINPFGLTDAATYGSNSELIDIDGDGDLDLMSGSSDGSFYYYENTANAGNTPVFNTPTPNPFNLSDIGSYSTPEIIDIDGDGDLDLISGASDGNFYYFRNIGSAGSVPSFAAPQTNPFGLSDVGAYSNLDLEDLDGDGDLDLMSTFNSSNILYFENTAAVGANTPAFAASVTNPFGLSYSGYRKDFDLEDIDSDGDLDLMWASNTGFRYYENTAGAGNTPAFASYVTNPFGLNYVSYRSNINIVDIDGDGDLDLMSGNGYTFNTFSYFENVAGAGNTPDFSTSLAAQINPFGLSDVGFWNDAFIIDIDGDGDLDLMSGEYYGSFYYFQNSAGAGNEPSFVSPPATNPFSLTNIGYRNSVELADMDGDGDLDLISGQYDGNFYYFRNIGSAGSAPSFAAPVTNPFGLSDVGIESNPKLVDMDGDGDLDLVSGEYSGNFFVFENIGTTTLPFFVSPPVTNPFGLTDIGATSNVEFVDLDGDGDLDLVSGSYNGVFNYFENTAGAGNTLSFAPSVTNPFGLNDIGDRSNSYFIDLDADGDLDMMSGEFNGDFYYFENVTCTFDPLLAEVSLLNDIQCNGDGDSGSFSISGSGATGPYEYSLNGGTSSLSGSFFDLAADDYTILVEDANGCDTTITVPITEPTAISVNVNSASINNPSCNGESDASFTTSVTGGIAPYDYSIDNGLTTQLDSVFSNLAVASYSVEVEDANGCTASLANDVVIQETDSIAFTSFNFVSPSSSTASDGEITVVAEGGTGQLTITWNPGNQMGATASGLSTGNYTVTVTDENNCEKTTSVFIDETTSINAVEVEDLAIYPNPTTGLVTVSFETTEQMDVEFNVVNTIGKTVFKETALAINGSFTTTFNLSNLGTGVYFLQLNNGKGIVTKKLTISK